MSSILLQDEENEMFGEEEDVDMPPADAAVKAEPEADVAEAVKEKNEGVQQESDETKQENDGIKQDDQGDEGVKQEDNEIKDDEDMFGEEEEEDVDMPLVDANGGAPVALDGTSAYAQQEPPTQPPVQQDAAQQVIPQEQALPPQTPPTLPPPSPFPQHTSGPSSDRLRNATHRITASPKNDAEAWGVLMNEVGSCWRSLGGLLDSSIDDAAGGMMSGGAGGVGMGGYTGGRIESLGAETLRKIDWIEACHLSLLHHFPYATSYIVNLAEIYLRLVARNSDEVSQCRDTGNGGGGGVVLTGRALMLSSAEESIRWKYYNDRLNGLFQEYLGVTSDGSPNLHGSTPGTTLDAMSATTLQGAKTILPTRIYSVPLWNIYIRKRLWDASHAAALQHPIPPPPVGYVPNMPQVSVLLQRYEESLKSTYNSRKQHIYSVVEKAYECAFEGGAGYIDQNHVYWRSYINFIKSQSNVVDCTAYVTPTTPPPPHEVVSPNLTLLRSIYQRSIVPMVGLDSVWMEYEAFEKSHSEALASVLIAEWLPKYQHARGVHVERSKFANVGKERLSVFPVGFDGVRVVGGRGVGGGVGGMDDGLDGAMGAKPTNEAEYLSQMEEEQSILAKWRRRAAYERTNPERLSSSDLVARVRYGYTEAACAFSRHPEVWYEWSQWELLHASSVAGSVATTTGQTNAPQNVNGTVSSGMLIAPAKAGDVKSGGNAIRSLAVLTLGMEMLPDCAFLAQAQAEILEKYLGVEEKVGERHGCIRVMEGFVDRSPTTLGFVLLQRLVRRYEGINAARAVFSRARRTLRVREEDETEGDEEAAADGTADSVKGSRRRMVTSRLKGTTSGTQSASEDAGFITWHLYVAHATVEHRLGKNPQVAARIYELGLRKHRSFISTPPYVLHYASLLLELNDEENLRSLLMRAVSACEDEDANAANNSGESDAAALARRREVQRPLWDMMLKFESILSSRANSGNVATDVAAIELRRRRALYGAGNEDVVLGREGPPDEEDLSIGVQKSSLNEQLIRLEGYDVASRISNGMARMVDVLTVTGAIGNGEFDTSSLDFASAASASLAAGGVSSNVWGDICAGGASDVSYVQRLRFQRESRARAATSTSVGPTGGSQSITGGTGKLLSSKERAAGAALGMGMNAMIIQNAPEWIRPLLLLLPPIPKFGRGLQKPPPHLVEITLSTLKGNVLPPRPVATAPTNGNTPIPIKRERENNDDSSDDEDGGAGGGYSNQFRARQRARLVAGGSAAS